MQAGKTRLTLSLFCLTFLCSGCMPWREQMAASAEQRDWWQANKARAQFVPNKGYAVEGVPGYFDANGRPLDQRPAQGIASSPRAKEDPNDGWLFDRIVGRDNAQSPEQAPAAAEVAAKPVTTASFEQPAPGESIVQAEGDSLPGASIETPPDQPTGLARFAPSNIFKSVKVATGYGPDQALARQTFREGEQLFRAGQYKEAAEKYETAANRWPDSAMEEDALYLQGESHFFADEYPKAGDAYETLVKKYANSRHLDKIVARQFAIANYWQDYYEVKPRWPITPNLTDKTRHVFDDSGYAMAAFDRVRLNDPRGPLADDAIMATANAFFLKGRWEDADYYYGLLRKDYPKSEHQVQAHLLGLQCKLRRYQGPNYEGAPLEEAQELIEQMLAQFPSELAGERERLLVAKKEVQAQRAQRDLVLAQFYDKGEHYDAARFYYAELVKNYPDSSFAEQAKQRMAQIQSEPGQPESRLVFIDRIFDREGYDRRMAEKQKNTAVR